MNTTVLCIDIGTTSLKAALISKKGHVEALSRQKVHGGERAADSWLSALAEAVKALPRKKLAAICVSGNGPTLVSVGGNTLLWNEPQGTESAVEKPTTSVRRQDYGFHVNTVPDFQSLWLPRLSLFKQHFPNVWQRDEFVFGAPEYLIWQLTGAAVTILPEERFRQVYWTDAQLTEAGFNEQERAKLPPFAAPTSLAGTVTKAAEETTGLKQGTRVYCGAPDFIAALVGTNTLRSGNMCDRAGTSEGLNLCTPLALTGPRIRTLPSIIPGLWNASVLIPDCGTRFEQYKSKVEFQTKRVFSHQALAEELLEHGGGHLPIPLAVEGRTLFEKLGREVQKAVATLTYAAFRTHMLTPDGKAGVSIPLPDEMVLSGAQAYSKPWIIYKSTIADITCKLTSCMDAELMGDNIFARVGMGEFTSIQEAADALVTIESTYFPTTAEQ